MTYYAAFNVSADIKCVCVFLREGVEMVVYKTVCIFFLSCMRE